MEAITDKINPIREKLFDEKFTNEIKELESQDLPHFQERLKILKLIIENKQKSKDLKFLKDNEETKHEEVTRLMFKKQWSRLPQMHKAMKIKEFIESLSLNKKLIKKLTKELTNAIYEGKLRSKKDVNYDSVNCKIISISALDYNENQKTYKLKKL